MTGRRLLVVGGIFLGVAACSAVENDLRKGLNYGMQSYQTTRKVDDPTARKVNARLWRASIDTLGFLPMYRADPRVGLIETDWYSPPGAPTERTKMKVEILHPDLRPDALRVSMARQVWYEGAWANAPAEAGAAIKLEEQILAKARVDRIEN